MFWKNYCSSKACFPIKQLWHTCISWSHQKSGVCESSDLSDSELPVITCVSGVFRTSDKNQTAYQAWCCLFPLLLYTHKILDTHKAYLKHTYVTLACIFCTLCWNMLLWVRLSWLSNCLCLCEWQNSSRGVEQLVYHLVFKDEECIIIWVYLDAHTAYTVICCLTMFVCGSYMCIGGFTLVLFTADVQGRHSRRFGRWQWEQDRCVPQNINEKSLKINK